jgi:NhaA family Na+:H+ antiporter
MAVRTIMSDSSGRGRRRIADLLHSDIAGSWILAVAVAVALIWANSRWGSSYSSVWEHPTHVGGSTFEDFTTVRSWVNGGLMAIFFFVVGLEIARERRTGELGDLRTAMVPVMGALGGMAGAGLVFVAFNQGGPGARGWGIPMATDIAFALGALALLGRRVPPGLRLLLLTLAVADDIGSVLVLAIFYSSRTNAVALAGALVVTLVMVAIGRTRRAGVWPVLGGGVIVWVLLAAGGVEPALAGVIAGVLVPSRLAGSDRDPAERLEVLVSPVSAFIVLPLFALANAGIVIRSGVLAPPGAHDVFFGVAAARVLGKLVGITGACALVVRLGWGRLPAGVRWVHVAGGAAVAGIGFTVPLLIAEQAFVGRPELVTASELGLLVGSVLAFVVGAVILIAAGRSGVSQNATVPEPTGDSDDGLSITW